MIDIKHIPIGKIITFPSNGGEKFKCCLHEFFDVLNASVRNPGPPPGFGGFEGDLLQIIVDRLGMNCDYYIAGDDWGRRMEHNIWTGCRGMMQRKDVDFVLGAHMKHHWINVFAQSSVSYQKERITFISKLPLAVPTSDVIIRTFDVGLWVSILVCIYLVAFVFYWMQKRRYSMVDQIISRVAELLLQEPVAKINSSVSLEILCIFWTLSAQFIALSYMAVILGIMMMPKRAPPLDTDEKLLEAVKLGKYKVGTPFELPQFTSMMLHSSNSKHVELGKIISKNNWRPDITTENIVSFLENDWGLSAATTVRRKLIPAGYKYINSKDVVFDADLSPIVSRSWPLNKKLATLITKVVEHGIYARDFEEYIFKFRLKSDINSAPKTDNGIRPLNLSDLEGAFLLLGTGLGISTIVLIYEIVSFKISKKIGLKNPKQYMKYRNQGAININKK